tara:strand:+ start:1134 stop:1316 length:183 start_codon:yes stop_codon:yes gene_type:complete
MAQRLNIFALGKPASSLAHQGAYFDKAILRSSVKRLLWLRWAVMIANPLYLKAFAFIIVY